MYEHERVLWARIVISAKQRAFMAVPQAVSGQRQSMVTGWAISRRTKAEYGRRIEVIRRLVSETHIDTEDLYWMTMATMDEWQRCDTVSPSDLLGKEHPEHVGGRHASQGHTIPNPDSLKIVEEPGMLNPCTPHKAASSSNLAPIQHLSPEKRALIERSRQAALAMRAKRKCSVTPDDEAAIFEAQQWLP